MKIAVVGTLADSLINFRGPLIKELVDRGHSVIAMAAGQDHLSGVLGDPEQALRDLGAKPIWYSLDRTGMNPLRDFRTLLELRRIFSQERPDVILSYTVKANVYASWAAKLARVPRSYSMITGLAVGLRTPEDQKTRRGKLMALMYRTALSKNAGVIFQNSDDEDFFREIGVVGTTQKTYIVNGSGVDLSHYASAPMPTGPMRFLLIARLLKDKGLFEYAEAAALVKVNYSDVQFDLVGPFDPHPQAVRKDQVDEWVSQGAIQYHGAQKDVRPFLENCSVYVLPSYREGTPRTVLEALAVGRPVITTDAPGCRQTVDHEVNGLLVPVGDSKALAQAMISLIEDRNKVNKMASKSLEKAHQFDVRSVNAAIVKILGA